MAVVEGGMITPQVIGKSKPDNLMKQPLKPSIGDSGKNVPAMGEDGLRLSRRTHKRIVTVTSSRSDVLHKRAKFVKKVSDEVLNLVQDMVKIMRDVNGVGLAAPQIGISRRVFVAEVEEQLYILIDPVVTWKRGHEVDLEGCLSIPGLLAEVPRAYWVEVRAKNEKGKGITLRVKGLLARVFQHEIDHLDGILITDRVKDPSRIHVATMNGDVEVTSINNEMP